jgi:hypothetical protein
MNANQPINQTQPARTGRWRFTYLILGLALVLLVAALIASAWRGQTRHEAAVPVPGLEAVAVALRAFHQQTGRFPNDFRELDTRLWKNAKQAQISADGKSLTAPAAHYHYTLHVTNPPTGGNAAQPPQAGLWAVPTGPRAHEAATHFWYLTPTVLERWMGPALTAEQVSAVRAWPTEQQLALLVMTKQVSDNATRQAAGHRFPWLGF